MVNAFLLNAHLFYEPVSSLLQQGNDLMTLSVFNRLPLTQLRRRRSLVTSDSPCFFSNFTLRLLLLTLLLLTFFTTNLWAWPANGDWIPIYRGNDMLTDPMDSATTREIVGDATHSAAYLFNDGNYIYFRVRLDVNPLDHTGTTLTAFGWGFLLDLNLNLDDYEYMIMLNGITNPETMYLARNTQQGIIGDPSDKAEVILWQENLNYGNNFRVLSATDNGGPTTTFGGDNDFYLDYFIPYDVFKNSMGLTDNSVLRYFVGSSNSAQTLSADLVAGSTLYDGTSNFVLPSGKQPSTGSVAFVTNLAGATDLTEFYAGATVYLRVIDIDLNTAASSAQTVTVTVIAPSGDSQIVTLTETGLDTSVFTCALATSDGLPIAGDGKLQVTPIEIVTVTYNDAADGTTPIPLKDQPRVDTARVLPAADIAVAKSVDTATPNVGSTIVYTIRATNNGPSSASGIQISDLLPAGVTYLTHSAPAGTSYNPGTGLWTAGSLAKDAHKELTISATVNNGTAQTTITNTASRTAAAQPDPFPGNDSAAASFSVTGSDLAITKTVNNPTPAVGGTVRFTITVTNNGTYPATNVVVTDLMPIATWSAVNIVSASQGTTAYSSGTLTWNLGSLAYPGLGNTCTLVVDATLAGSVVSGTTLVNTATISLVDQKDPHPGDDSASVTMVVGGIDLLVSKVVTSPSPATPDEGGTVVFTVTVRNSSSAFTTATGVEVTDLLPADLTYVSAVPSQGSYTQGNGKWTGITLAPGASATLTLTATVKPNTAGRIITNNATVTGYNQVDVNTANHSASATIAVRAIDLRVTKTVSNATPANGASIVYTVTVTNLGSITATGVSIFDQLPGQVTAPVANSGGNGSYSTTTNLWSGITLAPGATATLTITATVSLGSQDPKTFFNTAALDASTLGDNNATNDVASAVVSVNGTDLGLTKTMQTGYTDYPASGTTTKFLITLTNYGPSIATGIKVVDLNPTGLSCNSATFTAGAFTNTGGKCDWTLTSLAVGASASMVLDSTVSAANGSTVTNRATINAVDQSDPTADNNTANKIIYVGASDLAVTKTVDNSTPNIGNTVKFTITLTNNGSNNVTGIQVTDLLPAGMTYSSHTASNGNANYNTSTGIWTVGTVNFPGSATLDLNATVNAGTGGTVISNEARITAAASLDPNTANNRATASITVQQADVYVNKEANTLTPYVDETVTFTITAGNHGPNSVTNLVVRDLLANKPDSAATPSPVFTGLVVTPSQGSYDSATGNWSVGTVAKNAVATLTLTATLATGSEGKNITNSASKLSADQTDSNAANDSETLVITPQLLTIDLRLTKAGPATPPVEGADVVFTLTLYNLHGSRSASGIIVTDTLPAGLTFVSATTATGSITATPAVGSVGDVVWNVGSLAAMSNVTLTLTAKTACGSFGTTFTNSATISARGEADPDIANNTATAAVTPTAAAPSLTILKSANPAAAKPGQDITYSIQITNFGCGQAADVVVDDHMSGYVAWNINGYGIGQPFLFSDSDPVSGLSMGSPDYLDNVTNAWGYLLQSMGWGAPIGYDGTVTNWRIPMAGNLRPGGSFTLRYKAQIK